MGHVTPTTPPDPGTCPDCCGDFFPNIFARFTVPGMTPFIGSLQRDEVDPCKFEGLLADGVNGNIPMFLNFCTDGDKTNMICGPPLAAQCGGVIIDENNCWPWIDETSAGGCRYEVWP